MKSIIKNNKYIYLLVSCILLIASCDVFNLEEHPKSTISPNNYFNTPDQVETVLAATMARLYSNWGGYSYDPAIHRHTDENAGGNLVIPLNHGAGKYAVHYSNIKDLNFALRAIKEGKLSKSPIEEVDKLSGQLKFLRAWNYFMLVRMWGGIPVLTEDNTDDYFILLPPRASVAEVYKLIESDFLEAVNKLPDDWGSYGRPTKNVAKGMLAKVYITMATAPLNDASYYPKSAQMAKEVIDSKKYSLVPDIRNVFSFETEEGPEMMWSFMANAQYRSTDPRVWSAIYGWGDYSADVMWVDSVYPEQPRKHIYLETHNLEGVSHKELGEGVGIKKYLYDTMENFYKGITTVNMPILRYADVLLIFAEAENMAKGGPTQEAVDAINAVILRANDYEANPDYPLLTTNMSKEEFDKAVIHERNLELCFEYDRWMDIIRKRILYEVSRESYRVNFTEDDYLFPIPEYEMRLNPNMTQNPGY